jgi:dihydrofolate reductase
MGKLSYSAIMSLDGYIVAKDGLFDWAEPDEEVHAFVNDLERQVGTYLYGRRMYEVMAAWDTLQTHDTLPTGEKPRRLTTRQAAHTQRSSWRWVCPSHR